MPVRGAAEIRGRLRRIRIAVEREIAAQLDDNAEDLLERSDNLAPQLSGQLIASGGIRSRNARGVARRTVFYDAPYAVVRHEDFYNLGPVSSLKRSPDGPIGRKYLERAFAIHAARYQAELGEAIERGLRLGARV